ncbi:hypothetical protein [Sagittula salina]|uniref:Uncharacterized protein n=1 Tax=Sagittula salina TaxID=2820268 RepID=A0A940MR72_9RHOB|nr:hypothetical protein [Sagittula salina]MBP0482562.1 hypothetical protein [Sagittula salina]
MRVTTLEEALDLILIWAGRADIVLPPRHDAEGVPPGLGLVVAVSDLLGDGAFTPNRAPLLTTQDRILRPEEMRPDRGDYVPFIIEAHGLYSLGFRPGLPQRLFVSGDWVLASDETVPPGWRTLPMTPEEALINAVLTNGFFGLSARLAVRDEPDFDTVPADCTKLVWRHDAMGKQWPGFWTDEARTRLHFGGFAQTLLR